jgi:hypothetical protein
MTTIKRWPLALVTAFLVASCSASAPDSGGVHVEVLAGIRHVAPGAAWDLEVQSYRAANAELLRRNGYRIVITPLSDSSLAEASIFDEVAPNASLFGSNNDDADSQLKAAEKKAEETLAILDSRRSGKMRTEILNAIVGAKDRFEADARRPRRLLIVEATGFEQSSVVNMADYNLKLNSPVIRRRLIDHLKATGQIVDLRGVEVCMLGITSGEGNWSDYNRSRGVRLFWTDYYTAAEADLVGYGGAVASCRPIATNRVGAR